MIPKGFPQNLKAFVQFPAVVTAKFVVFNVPGKLTPPDLFPICSLQLVYTADCMLLSCQTATLFKWITNFEINHICHYLLICFGLDSNIVHFNIDNPNRNIF